MLNCGIYKIENLVNGNIYIGKSSNLNHRRIKHFSELRNKKHKNKHLENAFHKYGEKNFIFKVILYCEPEELTYYEQSLVDLLKPEYNICKECVDNLLGVPRSEETKRKISENTVHKSGEEHWNFGKHHTEETKIKISNSNKGKIRSEETIKNLSQSHMGQVHSRESLDKMIESSKGKNALSKEFVLKIKQLIENGLRTKDICEILDTNNSAIAKVKNGGYLDIYGIEKPIITKKVNSFQGIKKNSNTSKYIGIYRGKNRKNWQINISCFGESFSISGFPTEIEAALAYNEIALEMLGWKAKLNIISQEEMENNWQVNLDNKTSPPDEEE
jgi:group I intron endonuclease